MNFLFFVLFMKQIKGDGDNSKNTPQFFDKTAQSDRLEKIGRRINADTTVKANNSDAYREEYDYFYCTVTVYESSFQKCYAFGSNIAGPNGGAMYFFESTVDIKNTSFKENKAADGGALCFIQSDVHLHKDNPNHSCTFENNIAYSAGGAILFEGIKVSEEHPKGNHFYIFDCKFLSNKAHQTGGAIQIELQSNAHFERVTIRYNQAGDNGGAIYAKDTNLIIFDSKIQANEAGKTFQQEILESKSNANTNSGAGTGTGTKANRLYLMDSNHTIRFAGRGCGGIAFLTSTVIVDGSLDVPVNPFSLETQNNCFKYNKMFDGITKPLESTSNHSEKGNDVLLENQVSWKSFQDCFENSNTAWAYIGKDDNRKMYVQVYDNKSAASDKCDSKSITSNYTTIKYNTIQPVYANESNTNDSNSAVYIPPPSTFIYVATPISQMPRRTTQSHLYTKQTTKQNMWSSAISDLQTRSPATIPKRTVPSIYSVPQLKKPINISLVKDDPKYTVTVSTTRVESYIITNTYLYNISDFDYPLFLTKIKTIVLVESNITFNSIAPNVEASKSKVLTTSYVNVSTTLIVPSLSETDTFTNTTTTEKRSETHTMKSTKTLTETMVKITTFILSSTLVETDIMIPLSDEQTLKENKSPTTIIILSVIGCIAVFCLAAIALFLYRKTHSESSTSGSESLDDDDVFGDETKFSNQIVEFTQEDDSNMLSTFNGEPEIQEAPDEDEVFLNGEF